MIRQRRGASLLANPRGVQAVVVVSLGLLLAGCGGRRSERVTTVPVMSPPPPAVIAREPDMTVIAAPAANERTRVVTAAPSPTGSTTVISQNPPAPAPPGLVITPPPAPVSPSPSTSPAQWDPTEPDRYGFDGEKYLSLVTAEEVDILRLRSRGDMASHLSRFLSEKEKENLRRRAAELTEIGADPLQVGE